MNSAINTAQQIITGALAVALLHGCAPLHSDVPGRLAEHVNPAEEYSKAARSGDADSFSIYRVASPTYDPRAAQPTMAAGATQGFGSAELYRVGGDPDLLQRGWSYHGSVEAPKTLPDSPAPVEQIPQAAVIAPPAARRVGPAQNFPITMPLPAPGSYSPYYRGQMTANPSLWPGDNEGSSLFRDFRAFQPMDVITIQISEDNRGTKKAETDTKSDYSLAAAISNFFGLETSEWSANNDNLDPTALLNASTETEYKGEGETLRSGTLSGTLSAVIMEVLPNGLLRVEGTKILSVNSEEEVMVVSGLVRQRDVDAQNRVSSSRIANMRIDFYGRGLVAEQQSPGWGARIFNMVWPF
ncbi:MAG: flagellar basal body L-ring protein FlgH [Bdellovibrionales bacterium]|nr:flagellar basal body L-ring protein FlgH [Bdellovibrionales bacterium]